MGQFRHSRLRIRPCKGLITLQITLLLLNKTLRGSYYICTPSNQASLDTRDGK
ncbi:hypothetical protein PghCCS26_23170 [Paenibacillus glycanilyticus]|uniref:Uncharacterized protein n=1 Tax=Paenibacillus glycanilyticus TaxID=126569 RepID=A0ABQ6NK86_9BACL|nr:hypothetical protein PghCCS26_23170 [Paenibacillus glycanilyticus]